MYQRLPGYDNFLLRWLTFECIHITLYLNEGNYHVWNHVQKVTEGTKVEECPIDKYEKYIFFHT